MNESELKDPGLDRFIKETQEKAQKRKSLVPPEKEPHGYVTLEPNKIQLFPGWFFVDGYDSLAIRMSTIRSVSKIYPASFLKEDGIKDWQCFSIWCADITKPIEIKRETRQEIEEIRGRLFRSMQGWEEA